MKLRTVISGGQTGADKTGLRCAKQLGLAVGGTAPKGYRTEDGVDHELKDYGLVESPHWDYAPRTKQNAADGDVTLWFGNLSSPGYWCTRNACKAHNKPFYENPSEMQLEHLANTYEVWNVAGNRKSKNTLVVGLVEKAFRFVGELLAKETK